MTNLMTLDQLCDLLQSDRRTLYRMRKAGEGPPEFKIGRKVLFDRAEVQKWLERHKRHRLD